MNANTPREPDASDLPEPVIRSGKRQVSIVWLVPVVAILIGPEITITFNTAEGLEAGKTKIKCKDVEIGLVEEISLSKDLTQVLVKAQLVREAEAYLSDNSRFWVVRARVSASSVTGLGTVFSGAYIDIDPGAPGKKIHHFKGLEDPPIVTTWEKGRHFTLVAERKGSLDIGSPVYYRQLEVGRVAAYTMAPDGSMSRLVFIRDPYPGFVRRTRASGCERYRCEDGRAGHSGQHRVVRLHLVGGLPSTSSKPSGPRSRPQWRTSLSPLPGREAAGENLHRKRPASALHHLGPRPFSRSTGGIPGDPDRTCGRSQTGVRPKENDV
jgi:paraquat-inducible protein B